MSNRQRGSRNARSSSNDSTNRRRRTYQRRSSEAVKNRADQNGSNYDKFIKTGFVEFKPDAGDHDLRILPPSWDDAEHCGLEIFLHYGIGANGSSYLCPKEMRAEECPICKERDRALQEGDDDYATKLRANKRVLHWVIDRNSEKDGPKFWPMPWTVDRDIAVLSYDKKNGEVLSYDDPDSGYDIEFSRSGTGLKTKYFGLAIARNSSNLGDKSEDWLDYIEDNPLTQILNFYDFEHLQTAINGGVKEYGETSNNEANNQGQSKPESRSSKAGSDASDWKGIHGMGLDALDALVESKGLDLDPSDYSSEEANLYADDVCKILGLTDVNSQGDHSSGMEERVNRSRSRRS